MPTRNWDDLMIEKFRKDPSHAVALVNMILADGDDQGELRVVLGQMAKAFSGSHSFNDTGEEALRLYEALPERGDLTLEMVSPLLRAMGLCFTVRMAAASSAPEEQALAS